ncbi:MAG: hypothetical protein ACTHMM_13450 [Agriterribacter sp.]
MQTSPITEALKKSADSQPFPFKKLSGFGLRYSIIPKEKAERMVLYIDNDTHLALARIGLEHKLTADELLRRLAWLLASEG